MVAALPDPVGAQKLHALQPYQLHLFGLLFAAQCARHCPSTAGAAGVRAGVGAGVGATVGATVGAGAAGGAGGVAAPQSTVTSPNAASPEYEDPRTYLKLNDAAVKATLARCQSRPWLPDLLHTSAPSDDVTLSVPMVVPYMLYWKVTESTGHSAT